MIKVNQKGFDVTVTYIDEMEQEHIASVFCKDVEAARDLKKEVNEAVKEGYGFAKCRAILEGDSL